MGSAQFKNYDLYSEDFSVGDSYRKEYADSLDAYIEKCRIESLKNKECFMPPEEYAKNPEIFREKYIKMLGSPLTEYKEDDVAGTESYVATDDLAEIYRVSLEVMPGFKFYGMIMIPVKNDGSGKYPLVICQHGGGGTPELCSDMNGDNNYSHMTRRILEYGAVVFAPQLALWNTQHYNVPFNRGVMDRELKRYGSSIFALEIYCIKKAIDYMVRKPYVDKEKIAMHGLSYGGIYTMYTMAADTRIKAGYNCASFNDRASHTVLGDVWFTNSGNTFMDAEIAGLCAPRHLYIDVGKADTVFDYPNAVKEFERVPKYFEALGVPQNVKFNLWEGGHTVSDTDDGHKFIFGAIGYGQNTL